MPSLALKKLAQRIGAVEVRRNPARRYVMFDGIIREGEDVDMAVAKWRHEHGLPMQGDSAVRVIVSNVPKRGDPDLDLPRIECCTRASVAEAAPKVKARLEHWARLGEAPEETRRIAAHWAMLLQHFGIEDKP
jgi:hypothetical protein